MLTQQDYDLTLEISYSKSSALLIYYDIGDGFKENQMVSATLKKGTNKITVPITTKPDHRIKRVRLDFGWDNTLKNVKINEISLNDNNKTLFRLKGKNVNKQIAYANDSAIDLDNIGLLTMDTSKNPFDPYVVFSPLNELIFPKWQRVLLLVLPWILLLIPPWLKWLRQLRRHGAYSLFFVGLFVVSIPLKIAWITFTTFLLLAYALFQFYKKRQFRLGTVPLALTLLFSIPALFIGDGDSSELTIPLGFVLFALISCMIDFSKNQEIIKKIYIIIFFVLLSMIFSSWAVLMLYDGYYYGITFSEYFSEIKLHARAILFWIYYQHPTFLSFYILIGSLFCFDIYKKRTVSATFLIIYNVLTLACLITLGSRWALLLGVALPFLYQIPLRHFGKWLLPAWAIILGAIVYFIDRLDAQRAELWELAWSAIKQKPWLGHGTGTSSAILPDYLTIDQAGVKDMLEINHVHNQILTYLLENGLLGTFVFLGAIGLLVYHFVQLQNRTMLVIIFMVLCLCIIESPFKTATPLYGISFLLVIFSQVRTRNENGINKE